MRSTSTPAVPAGRARQRGFTYLMVLGWVALSGVMLVTLAQNWRFERQREREAEMVARAREIALAIGRYHAVAVPGQPGRWPASLQDLVEDRRGPRPVRHLRRVWADPLTGQADWGLVRVGPAGAPPGIQAIYSRATTEPIRPPEQVRRYRDWVFDAVNPTTAAAPQGASSGPLDP